MRAVVLVGGVGSRLRPLTLTRPKQMVPVLHRPMIEHVLAHLADHGIEEAVLSMGYRADAFVDAYPDGTCAGVQLSYVVEPEPLDTAGAVRFAALEAGVDERFLVVNGDVLTDLDITALVDVHVERAAEGTIALHKVEDPSAFGVVATDARDRVTAFVEKPPREEAPTDLINTGTYVLEAPVLDRIEGGRRVSIEREVFPAMVAEGCLYAVPGDSYWIDAGTPEQYLRAQLDMMGGVRGEPAEGVHPTAQVDLGAMVVRSVIGPGAQVGAGASVVEAAVLQDAVIADGATVERSIVGVGAVVGHGAAVTGLCVLGDGARVDPGEALDHVRRPN